LVHLPPGLAPSVFADGISEMRGIVGADWVFTSDEDVALYRDAYSVLWDEPEEPLASAAVAPKTLEEVQAIVRVCNARGIPLYPISTGRNLGYGGSAPVYSGSVVLDLKRMNRVIEVNEGNASCLVEPGVSYFDMYKHLQATGSKLWLDVPAPGWGSMVGNALDSGGGYTAASYRGHFEAQCGIEAVLADGEVLRTGMGAMPGSETWQQYRMGIGPCLDGLFRQSSLGVVTKMGFWLFPQPETCFTASLELMHFADIEPMMALLNELEYSNIFNGMPSVGSPVLQGGGGTHWQQIPLPEEMDAKVRETGLAAWRASLIFYGPEKVVRAQWDYVRERFSAAFPDVRFKEDELIRLPLDAGMLEKVFKARFGVPSLERFVLGSRTPEDPDPSDGHIWISAVIPRSGKGLVDATRVMLRECERLKLPVMVFSPSIFCWTRSLIMFVAVKVFKNRQDNARLRASVFELIRILADNGWGEYRCPPAFQDAVMDAYGYNDHILRRVNERIKDALDPNGILSVGRYGVWPKRLRPR